MQGLSRQPVTWFLAPRLLRSRMGSKASTDPFLVAWIAAGFDLTSEGSSLLLEKLFCCKQAFLTPLLFRGTRLWKVKVNMLNREEKRHRSFAFSPSIKFPLSPQCKVCLRVSRSQTNTHTYIEIKPEFIPIIPSGKYNNISSPLHAPQMIFKGQMSFAQGRLKCLSLQVD